jgi:hypothetical protein
MAALSENLIGPIKNCYDGRGVEFVPQPSALYNDLSHFPVRAGVSTFEGAASWPLAPPAT